MSTDISNNDMLAEIRKEFVATRALFGNGGGTSWNPPSSPDAPKLPGEPGADNQPFQVKPPVVRMPPIAEVVEMMPTRQKGWEGKGYAFNEPSVRMWLTNLLHNWEQNGVTYEPWYVGAQLQSHADAWTAQWLDTGTGVDVKAIITGLVQHYIAWRADQAK